MSIIGTEPNIAHECFLKSIDIIDTAQSIDSIAIKRRTFLDYTAISYHHLPAIGSYDYDQKGRYWTDKLPPEVITYFDSYNGKADPVMEYVLSKGRPYWLSQLRDMADLSDTDNMRRINLAIKYTGGGIVMPLFGPFHRRGYVFVSFDKNHEFFDDIFMWQVHALIQALHVKYCLIIESLRMSVKLTARESEVLELITFGKTNPDIGNILGISTSTVAGYVKQIFLKLDVSDRVSAALRARSFTNRTTTNSET